MIQSKEAKETRFDAIMISLCSVVVVFRTAFTMFTKNGRYLRAFEVRTASMVHHLVMSGSCIALSRSFGISSTASYVTLPGSFF